jgi:nucleoside-diphosphate-sugar epimerase
VFSRIHADDIAQAIALSLEKPEAKGAFNLADDWPDTQPNVMTGAAQIAGLPGPRIEPFDPDKASPMQASFYAECRRVSNARAKAALGLGGLVIRAGGRGFRRSGISASR